MKAWLVKPGTPEQAKKAEENNKKYLEERAAKTRKYYGLDKPLIVNNGSIQTEEEFKKEPELDNFEFTMEQSEVGYKNFTVIQCKIKNIEWLYLAAKGHRRAKFDLENNKDTWLIP